MSGLGIVVIGRNEGERLVRCLASLGTEYPVVYVDSGSTDGSVVSALTLGVEVVELTSPPAFTAARARNAGLARLLERQPGIDYVQMVDGDCEVRRGWIEQSLNVLRDDPGLALVFGRRRERHPDRSIYNALCDHEWDTPVGEAPACGGDAMFRTAALRSVEGYSPNMIAGEDPEMSMRLRKRGWHLRRIAAEMTWHDADIRYFGQWWRRAKRGGHGFAEMAWRHPDARWPNWPRTCLSIVVWGGMFPIILIVSLAPAIACGGDWWWMPKFLTTVWIVQLTRIIRNGQRAGLSARIALARGFFLMIGKLPELIGLLHFHRNRRRGVGSTLIEYKAAGFL